MTTAVIITLVTIVWIPSFISPFFLSSPLSIYGSVFPRNAALFRTNIHFLVQYFWPDFHIQSARFRYVPLKTSLSLWWRRFPRKWTVKITTQNVPQIGLLLSTLQRFVTVIIIRVFWMSHHLGYCNVNYCVRCVWTNVFFYSTVNRFAVFNVGCCETSILVGLETVKQNVTSSCVTSQRWCTKRYGPVFQVSCPYSPISTLNNAEISKLMLISSMQI